jgi:hypothetical protein
MNSSEFLTRKEACAFLRALGCKVAPQTLANKAANNNKGKGPRFTRDGWNCVLYHKEDLRRWAAGRKIQVIE